MTLVWHHLNWCHFSIFLYLINQKEKNSKKVNFLVYLRGRWESMVQNRYGWCYDVSVQWLKSIDPRSICRRSPSNDNDLYLRCLWQYDGKCKYKLNLRQSYDTLNRLVTWEDGESSASYSYYGGGKRATKTVDGVTTEQLWIGEQLQLECTEDTTLSYTHWIKLIESTHGSYLYNAQGDVVQLVKDNQVVQRYDYDVYGLAKDKQSKDKNDTNPFQYAGGNPVKHNDPSGTSWKNVFKKAKKKIEKSINKQVNKAAANQELALQKIQYMNN